MKNFAVALLLVAVATATTVCNNPLNRQARFKAFGAEAPVFLTTPAIQNSKVFCPALENSLSCCSDRTLNSMEVAFGKYEADLTHKLNTVLDLSVKKCNALDKKTGDNAKELESLRVKKLETIGEMAEACKEAALKHTRDMMCVSCSPSASEFVDAKHKVMINLDSIENLKQCSSMVSEIRAFHLMVKSHNKQLHKETCKNVELRVINTGKETVKLCISKSNANAAFVEYLKTVAKTLVDKYEFDATHTFKYEKTRVSVCDKEGCESQRISAQALTTFAEIVDQKLENFREGNPLPGKVLNPLNPFNPAKGDKEDGENGEKEEGDESEENDGTGDDLEDDEEENGGSRRRAGWFSKIRRDAKVKTADESRYRLAASAGFFDIEKLFHTDKKTRTVLAFVEKDGFRATTTTDTTTTAGGTKTETSTTAKVDNITDIIKKSLSNDTDGFSGYYNSALTLKAILGSFVLAALVFFN